MADEKQKDWQSWLIGVFIVVMIAGIITSIVLYADHGDLSDKTSHCTSVDLGNCTQNGECDQQCKAINPASYVICDPGNSSCKCLCSRPDIDQPPQPTLPLYPSPPEKKKKNICNIDLHDACGGNQQCDDECCNNLCSKGFLEGQGSCLQNWSCQCHYTC